ncbi:MAG: hypothetical protein KY476_16715 [Planctomycetes bacterium]|nr:hypothetical protein [Planctomycetota bacterium]
MNLTKEQELAVTQGEAVPVVVGEARCVLLRQDVYERVKRVLDDELQPEEAYNAVLEAWDAVGSPQDAEEC